ncbi:DNA mismatch repair protein MutT [Heyndrickxia shackletonii]|uniref:DNA mismatch repair protein MutT n=1 Tax=Heyndrickxia shackletonii TaxID=157838 RepID=A0A0Q3THX1_9BACI|nr:DNA mismatch repair protein MutT [Heyndrickxia shackletonii]NEY99633.1 NUDIX domain-containing protein [Heyndrickxia shackletonii]
MRNRGSVVLVDKENQKIGLIKRTREGTVYYVFPGGGIKEGETPEEATIREAYEELGVKVAIRELIGKLEYNGTQYFYLAEMMEGEFGTGAGEEFTDLKRNRGTYEPVWVYIEECAFIDIRPREVIDIIQRFVCI